MIITLAQYKAALEAGTRSTPLIRKEGPTEIVDPGTAEDRLVSFVDSSGSVDRDSDTINVNGWNLDHYRRNPVVLWGHDASDLPIAKCVAIDVVADRLVATFEFLPADVPIAGPKAEAVLRMLRSGFLAATSVGFLPLVADFTSDPARPRGLDIASAELMEISVVTYPSNRDALLLPGPVEAEERSAPAATSKSDIAARERRARLVTAMELASGK